MIKIKLYHEDLMRKICDEQNAQHCSTETMKKFSIEFYMSHRGKLKWNNDESRSFKDRGKMYTPYTISII